MKDNVSSDWPIDDVAYDASIQRELLKSKSRIHRIPSTGEALDTAVDNSRKNNLTFHLDLPPRLSTY